MSDDPHAWIDLPEGWVLTRQAGMGAFEEYYLTGPDQMVYGYRVSQRDWEAAPERMEEAVRGWVWRTLQENGKKMILQEKTV